MTTRSGMTGDGTGILDSVDIEMVLCVPTTVRFWGAETVIEPGLCSVIFGDGLQLVYMMDIRFRPHRWYARVDSFWNVNNGFECGDDDCENEDCAWANLDTLTEALALEFDIPDGFEHDENARLFEEGCCWGPQVWPGTHSHIWRQ